MPLCDCNDLSCERQHRSIIQRINALESTVFDTIVVGHEGGLIGRLQDLYTFLGFEYSQLEDDIGYVGVSIQDIFTFLELVVFSQRPRGR